MFVLLVCCFLFVSVFSSVVFYKNDHCLLEDQGKESWSNQEHLDPEAKPSYFNLVLVILRKLPIPFLLETFRPQESSLS